MTVRTNDHELKINSTTEKFTLVRDENGKPMYNIIEEIPRYQNPLRFIQENWVNGHGQYIYRDPEAYFEGQSIDTTQDGRLFLGPLINTVANTYTKVAIGAFKRFDDSTATYVDDTTDANSAAANDVSFELGSGASGPDTDDAMYFGYEAAFNQIIINYSTQGVHGAWTAVWEYYDGDSWETITVVDGTAAFAGEVGTHVSITFTPPGDWAATTIDSDNLFWIRYRMTANHDDPATEPLGTQIWIIPASGAATEAIGAAPVAFRWSNNLSKWFMITATKVFEYDDTNWVHIYTLDSGAFTDIVEFDDVLYFPTGSATTYKYTSDGRAFKDTDLSSTYAQKMFVSPNPAGTANVLYKFIQPNQLTYTTDGRNAADGGVEWSSIAYIGDTSNNITNIFLANDELLVGREDNLYHYDSSGGVHPYMDELKVSRSTNNFKYVTHWQGGTYFSRGTGVGEISASSTFESMGPLENISGIGKVGTCVGLASDPDFLYIDMDEGTNSHIYKSREVLTNRGLIWQHCPWVYLGTNASTVMEVCQHSATDRRLWFGYGTSTAYVIITDDPTASSAARYCTSGWLRMSYIYGTDPYWDNLWQSAVIEQHRVNSGAITAASTGETVQVKYRDDTDTSATSVISAYNTAGLVETNFGTAITDKRVQFEIHLASDTNTATPVVTYFQVKGIEKPTTVRTHEAYYRIGSRPSVKTSTLRDLLNTARTSTTLIKFADLRYGESTATTSYVWCVMEPGYPKEIEVVHEKGRQPELAIVVRLREVSFTVS